MSQKALKISGCVLSIVLALLFALSAFLKITQNETALAQASAMGFSAKTYLLIGVIELASLVLFLIPRTALLGSLLLIAYMGGAIATHLQHQQPIAIAVVVQVLLWITVAIRFPNFVKSLFSKARPSFQQF